MSEAVLPPFEEFKETVIGSIPVDWEVVPLSEVVTLSRKPRDLDLSTYKTIPFVPMELIPDNGVSVESYTPKHPSEIRSGTYFERDDILFARQGLPNPGLRLLMGIWLSPLSNKSGSLAGIAESRPDAVNGDMTIPLSIKSGSLARGCQIPA